MSVIISAKSGEIVGRSPNGLIVDQVFIHNNGKREILRDCEINHNPQIGSLMWRQRFVKREGRMVKKYFRFQGEQEGMLVWKEASVTKEEEFD